MASSSSSCELKYQVFLTFRGEDTRLNFTSHLLKALKDTGMNVFFDEDKLEKGEQLSLALSQAIAASNLSIIVLSADYASSKSCLAELSDIMERKGTQEHIVLPIFYHVDPSHVRNLGGSFKASFEEHESNVPLDEVKRWKAAFVDVGKLKGWHIEGGKFDRPEAEYIKDVVQYVIQKLNCKSRSFSDDLVGIDDQKNMILRLVEQRDSRVIGLWGMGGIGKTTLAEAVYNEISQTFQGCYFLQDVREKIEKQGKESLRNELLSKLLNSKTYIDTPSIGSTITQQRLNNMKVIVVLDDVNDSDQIDHLGVKYFGDGSKIIVTSRDRQVLKNGGVDEMHKVKKLNENDSLQLFSTFAFKLLNPTPDFRDLSNKFLEYAQGSPLALKVLGSKLYTKCREEWESEVDKLKEYAQPKIVHILRRSFDELDELEKNIFLDIACFLKGESKNNVEEILSCLYRGAVCGISNLLDKCLLHTDSHKWISMHDMLEEMGKDIVHQESKDPGKRSRLWSLKDVNQVLRYNKVNKSIEGIKLPKTRIEDMLFCTPNFGNMLNLRYLHLHTEHLLMNEMRDFEKLHVDGVDSTNEVDSISFPNELINLEKLLADEVDIPNEVDSAYEVDIISRSNELINLEKPPADINLEKLLADEVDVPDEVDSAYEVDIISLSNELISLEKPPADINLEKLLADEDDSAYEVDIISFSNELINLEKPLADKVDSISFSNELRYLFWMFLPFKSLSPSFNPKNLVVLKLQFGYMEQLWNEDHQELVNLREIDVRFSKKLRKVPNLSRAINLQSFICTGCGSLVELPRLNLLTRLKKFEFEGCHKLKKFPELPSFFSKLDLSHTGVEQVPDSIQLLVGLRELRLAYSQVESVSSNISKLESLRELDLFHCKRLKTLSNLPRHLFCLYADGCSSLEKVSFTDHNFNSFLSLHDGDDAPHAAEHISMSFSNCRSLNQESVQNIVDNAMLQIESLAQRWTRRKGISPNRLFFCFPGNNVSAKEFEHRSVNYRLNLKLNPNGSRGTRFLAFAICLVIDHWFANKCFEFICKYRLTSVGAEKLTREGQVIYTVARDPNPDQRFKYKVDHAFIMFSKDMIILDNDYDEASFELNINVGYGRRNKVERFGVHVFHVDAQSYTVSDSATERHGRPKRFKCSPC